MTYKNVIMNTVHEERTHIANFVILVYKQYVYRSKCQGHKPQYAQLKSIVYQSKNIEKYYALKNQNFRRYAKRWNEQYDEDQLNAIEQLYCELDEQ